MCFVTFHFSGVEFDSKVAGCRFELASIMIDRALFTDQVLIFLYFVRENVGWIGFAFFSCKALGHLLQEYERKRIMRE